MDYDAKELKALMGRHDSQKSTIIKVIVIVVVILVVLYLLSILSKYKMKKKRMAQKKETQEGSVRRQRVLQTSNVPDYSRKRPKVNYENDDFDFRNFRNRKY